MGEFLAAMYDPLMAPLDQMGLRRWREWAVSAARGRVLELGVGTGLNLPHYRTAERVEAIDPNGASLRRAFLRRDGKGSQLLLYQARAEDLPFPDRSFDAVVGTLVFCTIEDPDRALSQVRRVLKPGGTFRIVEHVKAENRAIGAAQDWLTPLWQQIAGGCHLNRETLASVEHAGFRIHAVHRHVGGLFVGIDAVRP